MKKTTCMLLIICLIFTIAETCCIGVGINEAENLSSKLDLKDVHNSRISRNTPINTTSLEINAHELHNSSVAISLPLSVKKVFLHGSE